MTNRNRLWALIQAYIDDPGHRYPPLAADLARETGVSDQVISKWKKKPMLPTVEQLAKFSRGTGIGYLELLASALVGKGYLPDVADISMEIISDDIAIDDFLAGQAMPPSGWAGTKLMGTNERGRGLTPIPTRGGDGNADDTGGSAPTKTPEAGPADQPAADVTAGNDKHLSAVDLDAEEDDSLLVDEAAYDPEADDHSKE